jgi:Trehalose utilisation
MTPEGDSLRTTRRDFLTQAGGTLAVVALSGTTPVAAEQPAKVFEPIAIPDWVYSVTRMAFVTPGDVLRAGKAGAQVVHTNVIWPYFPLRRDAGGPSKDDDRRMRDLVADCRRAGVRLCVGLPPFPPAALVKKHPDWRVHPDDSDAVEKVVADENNLGTRVCCNNGPWGEYLIDVCAELIADYKVDGFSFDGNYHSPLCFCSACKAAYKQDRKRNLPAKIDLDDIAYREYLVWRGEKLEDHYRRMQQRIKKENADAVLTSWTVNAGRYGHFLYSPRAMPTRLNLLFDLPMQEWWMDETNLGGSLAPSFGAAYLKAVTGGRPCASEPYLMSRGNPYGTDSFPAHERLTRVLLSLTHGGALAMSFGWSGHEDGVADDFREVTRRESGMKHATPLPWAALLVSEQTRQFYAYKDIADRWIPHVVGAFRAASEEHLPLTLINDWDLDAAELARYAVVMLPNAAALSGAQAEAVREYVRKGGGLAATGETSLCDELGRPRGDFALADLFGVSYQGRPRAPLQRPMLDANFAVALDEGYWKQRAGLATLTWTDHPLVRDDRLSRLVPHKSVNFRGPLVAVSEPKQADEVAVRMRPEGMNGPPLPAAVLRRFGEGRVAYFAAAVDAALWTYAYPYQRRLLARALEWAARSPAPVSVAAPMCVQATYWMQKDGDNRRMIVHLFNGVNTAANHGLPASEVPLREEVVPIHGIEVRIHKEAPKRFRCEPGGKVIEARQDGGDVVVAMPPLEIHTMLVGEY